MVRDMNEKGRVGWFVRGRRKGRGCHSQKSLRAPLVSLASFSLSLSHFFSRSYISRCGFEIIFTSRHQRLARATTRQPRDYHAIDYVPNGYFSSERKYLRDSPPRGNEGK